MRKAKVYAKLMGIGLVFLAVIIFLWQNRDLVSIKFLVWQTPEVPKFMFVISVGSIGIVLFKISTKIGKVVGEFRNIRREDKDRQDLIAEVKEKGQEQENESH